MKITKLETFFVKPRWVFLKIETDAGIVGWGEPTLEAWSHTIAAAVREMGAYLIGKDPRRIEQHWQVLYGGRFYRGGAVLVSALSGIEQALWDITGKALGAAVHELLGGRVRDRIRMYGHVKCIGGEDYALPSRNVLRGGLTAVKTTPFEAVRLIESKESLDRAVGRVASLREALGDGVDIAIDCHGRLSPATAKRFIRAVEPCEPMFIEEPVLPENVDAMVEIARGTSLPIATGERLYTKWGFRELLERRAAAVLQPDLSHAGGILEVRKIAAMAETHFASLAPHCPLGPISLAAALQVDACTPNFLVQEHVTLGEEYLTEPLVLKDGHIDVSSAPGLGIDVDESAVAAGRYDGEWTNPLWWHEDGGPATW